MTVPGCDIEDRQGPSAIRLHGGCGKRGDRSSQRRHGFGESDPFGRIRRFTVANHPTAVANHLGELCERVDRVIAGEVAGSGADIGR